MFNFFKKTKKLSKKDRFCIICHRNTITTEWDYICLSCAEQYMNKKVIIEIKNSDNINLIREIDEHEKNNLYKCDDGHFVKSRAEKIVDDTLYKQNIIHSYEKIIKTEKDKKGYITADFYLPKENIYIEYWGSNKKSYLERKKFKLNIYEEKKLTVIGLIDKDICNIEKTILEKTKNCKKGELNYCDIDILNQL